MICESGLLSPSLPLVLYLPMTQCAEADLRFNRETLKCLLMPNKYARLQPMFWLNCSDREPILLYTVYRLQGQRGRSRHRGERKQNIFSSVRREKLKDSSLMTWILNWPWNSAQSLCSELKWKEFKIQIKSKLDHSFTSFMKTSVRECSLEQLYNKLPAVGLAPGLFSSRHQTVNIHWPSLISRCTFKLVSVASVPTGLLTANDKQKHDAVYHPACW